MLVCDDHPHMHVLMLFCYAVDWFITRHSGLMCGVLPCRQNNLTDSLILFSVAIVGYLEWL